jgi:hypothetical protein
MSLSVVEKPPQLLPFCADGIIGRSALDELGDLGR